jgi:osmotically-inducible protein OsmY
MHSRREMANQNGRAQPGRNAHLPSSHRDDDRDRHGAMRDTDRELDDRYEPGRSWRPEDRGERGDRDERSSRRFEQGFGDRRSGDPRFGDPRFGDPRFGDPRFGDRDDDRGWGRRDERFSESDRHRDPYGFRDRDDRGERDRGERDRGELRVDIRGYRDPVEAMPRQDQLLRGAYRDHDESSRDLSYHAGSYGPDERAREARGGAGEPARERRPQRRGPHAGKGPVGFQRSDERIRELVCEALTDDGEIDATRIEVTVKGGEVTLTGAIEDRRMKRLAEDCVEQVPGVKDVHNQLRIGESSTAADRSGQAADRADKAADKHDRHERTAESSDKKHRPS